MKNPSKTITLFLPSQFSSDQSSPNIENLEDAANIDELIEEAMEENAEQNEKKPKIRRSEVQLGEIIGKGGMGLVHIGNQAIIERQVAIKKLRTVHPKLSRALIHEAKVMGSLEHPNIIPVHAVNIINETEPEVVMKYIQGTSFDKKISKKPTEKEIRENLQVLQQVCRPLEFAHSQEILHRDIKPENIMLGTFGEVYLLDWGLALETDKARSTAKGLVGTPSYMAPEMLSGDPTRVGVFTDVYLLGAVLHEVITGKRRHEGKTIKEALNQAERSVPYLYPKGIQSLLGEIANKACSRAVKYRYKSVMEFRIAISEIINRWDALSVSQAAEEKLAQLKELHTDPSGSQIQAHALYNQARFGFEQSLKLFPKNHRAKKGIDNCIHAMANLMIEMGQLDYGQSLLQELSRHDASLENKLLYLLAEEEKKKKAAKDLKRIADRHNPKYSALFRKRYSFLMALSCSLGIIATKGYEIIYQSPPTAERLLVLSGLVFAATLLVLLQERREVFAYPTGMKLAISMFFGSAAAFSSAYVGYALSLPQNVTTSFVIAIVGISFVNLYPLLKSGIIIFFLSAVLTVMSVLFEQNAQELLMTSIFFASLITFFEWNKAK